MAFESPIGKKKFFWTLARSLAHTDYIVSLPCHHVDSDWDNLLHVARKNGEMPNQCASMIPECVRTLAMLLSSAAQHKCTNVIGDIIELNLIQAKEICEPHFFCSPLKCTPRTEQIKITSKIQSCKSKIHDCFYFGVADKILST